MADLAAPGTLEIESGVYVGRNESETASVPAVRTWSTPFLLKQTFAKFIQAQIGSNAVTLANPNVRYFDNVFLGPKIHLFDQGKVLPSVALSALASFPTAEQQPGYTRHGNAFVTAYVSKDLDLLHLDVNVGVNILRIEDDPIAQSVVAVALTPTFLPAPFGFAAEVYGLSDAAPVAPRDGGVRLVATFTARSWLVFDVGGDIGFFPSTHTFGLFFGLSIVPFVFWR